VFLPVAFVMMFIAGVPGRYLGTLVAIGAVVVAIVFAVLLVPRTEEKRAATWEKLGLKKHWRERLMVFVDPDRDPRGAGWNREQSEIAVGSGGLWGKGFLQGRQNTLGFLSSVVAPTDFVFTVIAEEKGFAGSVAVLVLFGYLCVVGIRMAIRTRDMFGRLLCAGITSLLFCHVFINIAMTVGIMPITGLPLPLLSYGGSFTVVTLAALGLLQGIHLRSLPRVEGYV
jgi:rod shape determining protein RodA